MGEETQQRRTSTKLYMKELGFVTLTYISSSTASLLANDTFEVLGGEAAIRALTLEGSAVIENDDQKFPGSTVLKAGILVPFKVFLRYSSTKWKELNGSISITTTKGVDSY